jgi:hypothetical protein
VTREDRGTDDRARLDLNADRRGLIAASLQLARLHGGQYRAGRSGPNDSHSYVPLFIRYSKVATQTAVYLFMNF